jgi:chemotaxis regulatin CheY-phosphate phosphatase CheZ
MTSERIKEIQQQTAYPDSISVQQALLQVWNECMQNSYTEEQVRELIGKIRTELAKNNHNHYSVDYNELIESLKQQRSEGLGRPGR